MVAETRKCANDGGLHGRPVVNDLCVIEVQRLVAKSGCRGIPFQIFVAHSRAFVVFSTIHLDDQPPIYDEVDTSHRWNVHLAVQCDPDQVQPEAQQRLQPAFGIPSGDVDHQTSGCWQRSPYPSTSGIG